MGLITKLTQKDVLKMTKKERLENIDILTDKLCNIDYIENEIIYNMIAYNLTLIESKTLYNEF